MPFIFPRTNTVFAWLCAAFFASAILFGAPTHALAAIEIPADRVKEIAAMLQPKAVGLGKAIADRAAWETLAREPGFAKAINDAEALISKPMPQWSDDLYLDYSRTGNRNTGQAMIHSIRNRVRILAVAECLENKGRFLTPLKETIAAICAQPTWVYPAHDGGLKNFRGKTVEMDLNAVAVAWEIATADHLFGDTLGKASRDLIHTNLQRRIFQPFRDMVEGRRDEIGWMRRKNNWNAVCLAGVTGSALATLDSREERAWFIAAAQSYIRYFLASFTPDGYCSEGVGYWNYGYGNFLLLGETIRQATGGKIDLLADPAAIPPALFGQSDEIINGVYPTISDVSPGARAASDLVRYINLRLGRPIDHKSHNPFRDSSGQLFGVALFAFLEEPLPLVKKVPATESTARTWFKDGGVMICRPAKSSDPQFAAVLKGGHNAEQHNHNDVGSFSVVMGKTMLLCDPGAEVYTARTFSSRRYESKVINSFGHAVPVVAGKLQQTGEKARAVIVSEKLGDADNLNFDLRSAYEVPTLQKLERAFTFKRGMAPSLTVRDVVSFSQPATFETALITWSEWKKISDNELLFSEKGDAVRVRIDTGGKPFEIKSETLDEDVHAARKPVRLGIALKSPAKDAVVTMTITPDKPSAKR